MANSNAPFGLRSLSSANGAPSNFPLIRATIAYNNATKIFSGDPVAMTGTGGQIAQWVNASSVATNLWGVFRGCKYLSTSQGKVVYSAFWPGADVASGAQQTIVAYLEPIALSTTPYFIIQSGPAGCSVDNIGANVDVVLGTGNTYTGQSGAYLDSTYDTSATKPFRVMGLYGVGEFSDYNNVGPGSESGAYNWVVVAANNMLTTGV